MEKRLPVINEVRIIGNLVKDPEVRETGNGTPVVNFRIASSRRYKDRTGARREETCFVGVVAWARLADLCAQRLYKSDTVYIEGSLQTRNWEIDGQKRTMVEIHASKIQFLDKLDRKEYENKDERLPEDGPAELDSKSDFHEQDSDMTVQDNDMTDEERDGANETEQGN